VHVLLPPRLSDQVDDVALDFGTDSNFLGELAQVRASSTMMQAVIFSMG